MINYVVFKKITQKQVVNSTNKKLSTDPGDQKPLL
ncbi:MAG: hypothetical protein FD123_2847 [Bacteroidetes bacterium]|nr:MAG: hypothetical protein FD123_2847 [Bacteroidota bacterium]